MDTRISQPVLRLLILNAVQCLTNAPFNLPFSRGDVRKKVEISSDLLLSPVEKNPFFLRTRGLFFSTVSALVGKQLRTHLSNDRETVETIERDAVKMTRDERVAKLRNCKTCTRNRLFMVGVVATDDLRVRREFRNLENAFNPSVRNDDEARVTFSPEQRSIPKWN